jgi:hypothetical protein
MEQVEGHEVALFIRKAGVKTARKVLVGCILDDQSSEQGWQIMGVREDQKIESKRSDGQALLISADQLSRFLVIDERHPTLLRKAVDGFLSLRDLKKRHIESELKGAGLSPASAEDAETLFGVISDIKGGEQPTFEALQQFYEACKRSAASPDPQQKRRALLMGASVFEAIERMEGYINASIRIKLAFCLRHSGQIPLAIEATDFIEERGITKWVTPATMAILATERAAALADLYELDRNPDTLERAKRWAKRAYAISDGRSDEAKSVLRRVNSFD